MNTAGIDPDKIEIAVHNNTLRVFGSRDEKEVVEDKHYYKKEIRRGSFERIISLPSPVDQSKATAECKDGVLYIVLPKTKATKQSTIKIVKK